MSVEIYDRHASAVLYFALTERVEVGVPFAGMFEIFGSVLGKKNVSGITAIHHALGDVDPGTGNVPAFIDIQHAAHRAAVHTHAHLQLRMLVERTSYLESAFDRRLGRIVKDERHSIASWQAHQFAFRFGNLEFVSLAYHLIEHFDQAALLV